GLYANGEANFDAILKAHSGDTIRVDRIGRPPLFVPHPVLTIGMTVQPEVIRGLASNPAFRGRGLLSRFLYVMPPSNIGDRNPDPPPVPADVERSYFSSIFALAQLPWQPGPDGKPESARIHLSSESAMEVTQFLGRIEPELAADGCMAAIADWGSKLVGAPLRVAGLLHLAAHAGATPEDIPAEVSTDTFRNALNLSRYLIEHAQAGFETMGADIVQEDALRVLRWLARTHLDRCSERDLSRNFKDLGKTGHRAAVLEVLISRGYIRPETLPDRTGPGRRPGMIYVVNPAILMRKE
ncbi:MAG: YfjI family protein, partial [Planctomycetota bacterium]|nr:YfjI family protein [Planctomycetota bacterium]